MCPIHIFSPLFTCRYIFCGSIFMDIIMVSVVCATATYRYMYIVLMVRGNNMENGKEDRNNGFSFLTANVYCVLVVRFPFLI